MKRCLSGSETGMRVKSAIVFFADINLPGYPVSGRPLPEGTYDDTGFFRGPAGEAHFSGCTRQPSFAVAAEKSRESLCLIRWISRTVFFRRQTGFRDVAVCVPGLI